jgi:HAE1 family hydrophobic/amphiphilic exporter-1
MASRIGKKEDLQPTNIFNRFLLWFERQLDRFTEWYGSQLEWVLQHKLVFVGLVLVLFALTGAMMKQGVIGKELIATGDQGKFKLSLEYDKQVPLSENARISQQVEAHVLQQPEVASIFGNIGGPSTGIGSLGVGSENESEFTIQLKAEGEYADIHTETYMRKLREDLRQLFPQVRFSLVAMGLVPRTAPIELTLSGSNTDLVMNTGQRLKETLAAIPGADNVQLSVQEGNPEYRIVPDDERMQRLGLNAAYVGMNVRTAFTGNDDATITQNGVEYPVRVRLDAFDRRDRDDVEQLSIINPKGMAVELSQFADVVKADSPSMLERLDRQPAITLTADALGRPSGSVADDVLAYLVDHPLPEGVRMSWGSDIKRQNDSFGALGSVLLISFILIYLIMVALYDSFIYPFVVLFSIPVAAIGAFLALNLTMSHLSLFALLGLIMLMGLVTKNAILIVDFTNQLKADGKPFGEALVLAGKGRMRPILMTTISMVVGMLPIALATGSASEWKSGLAWVIIGGLMSSLILTVYLVPVVYYAFDELKLKVQTWRASR